MTTPPALLGPRKGHHGIFLFLGALAAVWRPRGTRLTGSNLAVRHNLLKTEAILAPEGISVLFHCDTSITGSPDLSVAERTWPHSDARHNGEASSFTVSGPWPALLTAHRSEGRAMHS